MVMRRRTIAQGQRDVDRDVLIASLPLIGATVGGREGYEWSDVLLPSEFVRSSPTFPGPSGGCAIREVFCGIAVKTPVVLYSATKKMRK